MKTKFNIAIISLICIFILIFLKSKNKNFLSNNLFIILVIFALINILLLIIQYIKSKIERNYRNQDIILYNKIDSKKAKCKSSNDELIKLIKEYKENNKSGEQK